MLHGLTLKASRLGNSYEGKKEVLKEYVNGSGSVSVGRNKINCKEEGA